MLCSAPYGLGMAVMSSPPLAEDCQFDDMAVQSLLIQLLYHPV